MPIVAAVGLILGVFAFAIYYAVNQYSRDTSAVIPAPNIVAPAPVQPVVSIAFAVAHSLAFSITIAIRKTFSNRHSHHTRARQPIPSRRVDQVLVQRQGGKPVIVLTSGAKIDADEVWRTRDGVWYRRNGMVTLLKRRQVKAIVTR